MRFSPKLSSKSKLCFLQGLLVCSYFQLGLWFCKGGIFLLCFPWLCLSLSPAFLSAVALQNLCPLILWCLVSFFVFPGLILYLCWAYSQCFSFSWKYFCIRPRLVLWVFCAAVECVFGAVERVKFRDATEVGLTHFTFIVLTIVYLITIENDIFLSFFQLLVTTL